MAFRWILSIITCPWNALVKESHGILSSCQPCYSSFQDSFHFGRGNIIFFFTVSVFLQGIPNRYLMIYSISQSHPDWNGVPHRYLMIYSITHSHPGWNDLSTSGWCPQKCVPCLHVKQVKRHVPFLSDNCTPPQIHNKYRIDAEQTMEVKVFHYGKYYHKGES